MKNGIEQHAVMVALLGKHAAAQAGEEGKEAMLSAVKRVGKERGSRMAARAIIHGDDLSYVNYLAYTEWRAGPGEMEADLNSEEGQAVQHVWKCPWNDAWSKYDLLEYGKYYCLPIDKALYKGFNYDFDLDVDANLSWGEKECKFRWNARLTEEELEELKKKREELGDRYIKTFDFHTGHVLYSAGQELIKLLGERGERAVKGAMEEFCTIFGRECLEAARKAYPEPCL